MLTFNHTNININFQTPMNGTDSDLLSYVSYTQFNLDLLHYLMTQFHKRLSWDGNIQDFWKKCFSHSVEHQHLLHISLAVVALDLHYQLVRKERGCPVEDEVVFSKALGASKQTYLQIGRHHHTKSLELVQSRLLPTTVEEAYCAVASSILQLLYLTANPEYHICDSMYFQVARGIQAVLETALPHLRENEKFARAVGRYLLRSPSCYSFKSPLLFAKDSVITQKHPLSYIPLYLYDMLHVQEFERARLQNVADPYVVNTFAPYGLKNIQLYYTVITRILMEFNSVVDINIKPAFRKMYGLSHDFHTSAEDTISKPEAEVVAVLSRFMFGLPAEIIDLVYVDDPRAVVIVAHLIMLMASYSFPLWTNDMFVQELAYVEDILVSKGNPEWVPWLNVPKRAVLRLASEQYAIYR